MDREDKAPPKAATPTKPPRTAKPTSKAAKRVTRKTPATSKAKTARAATRKPAKPKHPYMVSDQEWDKDKVMDIVYDKLATSSKGIGTILAAGHEGSTLPGYSTIARWLSEEDEDGANPLRERYARAKEAQADYMAEELAELHEKAWVPITDDDGKPVFDSAGRALCYVDKSSAAIVRLEAENKKWLMGKLRPKKYADKQAHEHTGAGGGAIQVASTVTFVNPPERGDDE